MNEKETVHGYEIQQAVVFNNNRGIAFAEKPKAVQPFVTWMFTEDEDGKRDYEWGHYSSNKHSAAKDFDNRIIEYQKEYGISDKNTFMYFSTQRPVDLGTFPKTEGGPSRIVNFDKREPVEQGRFEAWGYLIYAAPLTEKQADDYELRPASGNAALKKRIEDQTQIVGIWEDRQKIPEANRHTWYQPSIHAFALREPSVLPEQLEQRYHCAISDITRETEKTPTPKRIAEQLAEAGKQVERGADAPAKKHNKSHEDR